MKAIVIVLACALIAPAWAAPKRIYLEPRVRGHRNVTLELTREIMNRCPSAATITEEKQTADFSIGIASRATVLYRPNGDAAHVFKAKWTVIGISKEICAYMDAAR